MGCRMNSDFLKTPAPLFPGELNRWVIALVPSGYSDIWNGKSVPTDKQVRQMVWRFLLGFVVLPEERPKWALLDRNAETNKLFDKFIPSYRVLAHTVKRPDNWTGSVAHVPPLPASFYGNTALDSDYGGDDPQPAVYVGIEFEWEGTATETTGRATDDYRIEGARWPWGVGHGGIQPIPFLKTYCPENVYKGALLAVMPYVGMPRPVVKTPYRIAATNPAVAKEVVELGELDPLILDMGTKEKLKAADIKITIGPAVMEEEKSNLPLYLVLGVLGFIGFKKLGKS